MSGSLTRGSVSDVIAQFDLGAGDRFVDLGSGVGHVTLQVAEECPQLMWARGIEVIDETWSESCVRAERLRNNGLCPGPPAPLLQQSCSVASATRRWAVASHSGAFCRPR